MLLKSLPDLKWESLVVLVGAALYKMWHALLSSEELVVLRVSLIQKSYL